MIVSWKRTNESVLVVPIPLPGNLIRLFLISFLRHLKIGWQNLSRLMISRFVVALTRNGG